MLIRITAYDVDGGTHRVTVRVPSPFTEKQAKDAATRELGFEVVRVAFN